MIPDPFVYPKRKRARIEPSRSRVTPYKEAEALTGYVNGMDASDIEERFARSLGKHRNVQGFRFREMFFAPIRNIPGADEVDFLVYTYGMTYVIELDGAFSHKTLGQKAEDQQKDVVLNTYLAREGIPPVIRIPDGIVYPENILDTQEGADEVVEELFA